VSYLLFIFLDVDLSQEAPTHRGAADDVEDDWLEAIDEKEFVWLPGEQKPDDEMRI